jgi:hypothetical protein
VTSTRQPASRESAADGQRRCFVMERMLVT